MKKNPLKSKVLWFNLIGIGVIVAQSFGVDIPIDATTLAEVLAGGNGVLRFLTQDALALKPQA